MDKLIVWTVAGSDAGGGAGIQADLHTFQAFGAHGCSVVTALTAQNSHEVLSVEYTSSSMLNAQIKALAQDLPAKAIKLGLLGPQHIMEEVEQYLARFKGYVICDPVMVTTSGVELLEPAAKGFLADLIFPYVDLVTPNLPEAEAILGYRVSSDVEIEKAARAILKLGPKSVLIKGGHADGHYAQDYWTDGEQSFWLTVPRCQNNNSHGSGCTLSSAITACVAQGYSMLDALVLAKAYVTRGIRSAVQLGAGMGPVRQGGWPTSYLDFPWVTLSAEAGRKRIAFSDCGPDKLGLYPIVDRAHRLEQLLPLGIKTFQLRIKDLTGSELEQEIKTAVELARAYQCRLFINDHWELALKYKCFGVHLGQEDLLNADLQKLADGGLRLGLSVTSYTDAAYAHAIRPSYLSFGPIFHAKHHPGLTAIGLENLRRWVETLSGYPIVAFGGFLTTQIPELIKAGVTGVAVSDEICKAAQPEQEARKWLAALEQA